MNNVVANKIFKKIKELPCFTEQGKQIIDIRRIEAGQSSLCFEVVIQRLLATDLITETESYFVKYDDNTLFFSNELNASKAASLQGLSPKVYYAEQHWLVTEFIEGNTLDKINSSTQDKIDVALPLLEQCHKLRANVPQLNIKEILLDIIKSNSFTSEQVQRVDKLVSELPDITESQNNHLVLCHGDINFSNILIKHDKAMLIDFECSCLAELEFELAMFIAINKLTAIEESYTLKRYKALCESNENEINSDKLEQYLLYSYLINGLWYLEKAGKTGGANKFKLYELGIEQLSLFDSLYPSGLLAHFTSNS